MNVRGLATIKGIATLSTARRPSGMVEGPVGFWVALPDSLAANTGVDGTRQTYSAPTVVASFGSGGRLFQELARYKASGLVFAQSARGTTNSYAGIIHGLSADIMPQIGDGEIYWPQIIAQLWNGLGLAIVTDSGKSVFAVPLREIATIAPNLAMAVAADGNEEPTNVGFFGTTGACLRSGDPIMRIVPALPWTGQQGDDVILYYSGPALNLPGNPIRIFIRAWMIAAQVTTSDMQDGDGGVSNLDPGNCRSALTDRETQRILSRWVALQAGREDDGEA